MFFFLVAGVVTFSLFKCYTGIMTRKLFIWNLFLPASSVGLPVNISAGQNLPAPL